MQEVLDTQNIAIANRSDARKERLDATAVWERIGTATRVVVAKGKRVETFVLTEDAQDAILKAVMGRSGNLRAPTVQIADVFYVGYNDALYAGIPLSPEAIHVP